jgi:hypothetical protein
MGLIAYIEVKYRLEHKDQACVIELHYCDILPL